MSGGMACQHPRKHRGRWRVVVREANYSAFNGYRYTPSAYSSIRCLECPRRWRTRAAYVAQLPDLGPDEPDARTLPTGDQET